MSDSHSTSITIDSMRADIAQMLHESPEDIGDDDNLIELGLDSIRAMALLNKWSGDIFKPQFCTFTAEPTLRNWYQMISTSKPQP